MTSFLQQDISKPNINNRKTKAISANVIYALPTIDHHHHNISCLHHIRQVMAVDSSAAKRIVDDILLTSDEILAISVIDKKGDILAAKSKESFKEAFGITEDGEKYSATLAIGILTLVNELKDMFGEAQSIITTHKNCKLMLLPVPSYQIMITLVLHPSVNAEDHYNIAKKIERLMEYTAKSR
jgi:hypothetical protein